LNSCPSFTKTSDIRPVLGKERSILLPDVTTGDGVFKVTFTTGALPILLNRATTIIIPIIAVIG